MNSAAAELLLLTVCQRCGLSCEVTPVGILPTLESRTIWRAFCPSCGLIVYVMEQAAQPNNDRLGDSTGAPPDDGEPAGTRGDGE